MKLEGFQPLALSTASARISDLVRTSILNGSLAPGEQLTETQLADRLAVSRGPVREAMQRLVHEGLLWSKPHHGTFVVELGREDVADIYLARRAVEGAAAIRLIGMTDKQQALESLDAAVADLQTAVKAGERSAIISADLAFHEVSGRLGTKSPADADVPHSHGRDAVEYERRLGSSPRLDEPRRG